MEFKEKLTEKQLREHIKELYLEKPKDIEYMCYMNWCETNGMVLRSTDDLQICNDKNCVNCREIVEALVAPKSKVLDD
jgi:hypothetical protein